MIFDFAGQPIEPGDLVAYPVRHGSDMYLRTLKVSSVKGKCIHGSNDKGRIVKLLHADRCVVINSKENNDI